MNKCDLVSPDELNKIEQRLASLNPTASIVRSRYGCTTDGALAFDLIQGSAGQVSLDKYAHAAVVVRQFDVR